MILSAKIDYRHNINFKLQKNNQILFEMQASLVRLDWLKLYKALQRAGREFPQYSYRHFTRRRVRDYFEKYRTQTLGEERLGELYEVKHYCHLSTKVID